MGDKTKIQWTSGDDGTLGATWNPIRGCSRVSPGCGGAAGEGGCYAERQAARFSGPGGAYEGLVRIGKQGPRWTGVVRVVLEHLCDPIRWTRPRRIFVNSMSDLFHEKLTNEEIAAVFGVMAASPQHVFQILTKRSSRMREWFAWLDGERINAGCSHAAFCGEEASNRTSSGHYAYKFHTVAGSATWPLPNVWLGVSCEDQPRADERVPDLLATLAAVRWVSYEPALGPCDFTPYLKATLVTNEGLRVQHPDPRAVTSGGTWDTTRLDWVVCGGESGPGARRFDVSWGESVQKQCKDAGVGFFWKQMGANVTYAVPQTHEWPTARREDVGGTWRLHLRDAKGGDMEEWPDRVRVREYPKTTFAQVSA